MGWFKDWLTYILEGPVVLPPTAPTAPTPPAPVPVDPSTPLSKYVWDVPSMVFGGVDRGWPDMSPDEVCREAVLAGLTGISIELVDNDRFVRNPGGAKAPFEAYVRAARAHKLVLLVCLVNSWVGDGNLRSVGPKMLQLVLEQGPEGLLVQPVGETHSSAGSSFENSAITSLKVAKFKTCLNNAGGRPKNRGACDYFAYHAASPDDVGPAGCLWITDHGNLIRRYGLPPSVQKVTEDFTRVRKAGSRGAGLYLYYGMSDGPDKGTLPAKVPVAAWGAMGKLWGGSVAAPAPIPTTPGTLDEFPVGVKISRVVNVCSNGGHPFNPLIGRTDGQLDRAFVRGSLMSFIRGPLSGWPPLVWKGDEDPSDSAEPIPRGNTIAGTCAGWLEGETLYAGWFDHLGETQVAKTTGNIYGAYWTKHPPADAQLYAWLYCYDKVRHTRVVKVAKG